MSSDSRWTGGAANRGWQSGTRAEQPVDGEYIGAQVRRYLRDCERFKAMLRSADHPTEDGVLKVVHARTDAQKAAVLGAFRELTAGAR